MFVALLAIVFLCTTAAANEFPQAEVKLQALKDVKFASEWKKYKPAVERDTGMLTTTKEDMKLRRKMFRKAKKQAEANNADSDVEYVSGINEMSFMTDSEKSSFTGLNVSFYHSLEKRSPHVAKAVKLEKRSDSNSWWSSDNTWVTAIKDQGQCGSCWAFAAVSVLESKAKIAGGSLVQLSEQEVIDCNSDGAECEGGWYTNAWNYVHNNGRLASSASYSYAGAKGSCNSGSYSNALTRSINSYTAWTGVNSEALLATGIDSGPMAVAVCVGDNFMAYSSGTFNEAVDVGINHAVVAIGYDSTRFLIRNSWGTSWGIVGHIYLKRGVSTTYSLYYYAGGVTMNTSREEKKLE